MEAVGGFEIAHSKFYVGLIFLLLFICASSEVSLALEMTFGITSLRVEKGELLFANIWLLLDIEIPCISCWLQ
jgi:hypothetical protein